MRDAIYYEMFDSDDPTPVRAQAKDIFDPLWEIQRSDGTAELLAAQLEARHFAEQLVGMPLEKLRAETAIRQPIDVDTFEQQPLPHPSETDETGVRLCECKCQQCREQRKCAECSASPKCKFARCEDTAKAIAGMVGEMRGRLHPHGRNVPKETWQQLESAMTRYVTKALSDAPPLG